MKLFITAAVAALAVAACSGPASTPTDAASTTPATTEPAASAATAAINGPIAGKWKVTVMSAGMTLPPQEVCYDKQVSIEDAQKMQQQAGITCSENAFTPTAGGMTGHSVCKMAANAVMKETTITTDTVIAGDFNTAYTMDSTSTMDPAPAGMPPGPSKTSIKMERLGDCDTAAPGAPPAPQ